MIVKDGKGNELIAVINVNEERADEEYSPVNHCLAVVKIGDDYLMGWNRWRNNWEIFGGCRQSNETMRECIVRECREELGINDGNFEYLGLMYDKIAPGYFNPEWHYEYGGLYGICLPADYVKIIEKNRIDKEEIDKLSFYKDIKGKEKIALIDEKLLEYLK
jgi:ADP-ribose pyrophosphatase